MKKVDLEVTIEIDEDTRKALQAYLDMKKLTDAQIKDWAKDICTSALEHEMEHAWDAVT